MNEKVAQIALLAENEFYDRLPDDASEEQRRRVWNEVVDDISRALLDLYLDHDLETGIDGD